MLARLRESWPESRREQRKLSVLLALGALALVLWARAWVIPGPDVASGAADVNQPNMLRELSDQIERVYVRMQKREVRMPDPPVRVRDVFAISPDLVPPEVDPEPVVQVAPKSTTEPVESEDERVRRERQALVRSVQEEASQLRLRSTMVGKTTAAVIEVVRSRQSRPVVLLPGQSIEGFMLLEVSSSSVLLEKQGIVIELQVEQPGIQ
ncbi:MAG: hypothetical protein ACYTF7_01640 [Planctomycetota bacterium]|jgi:hypothetical protein